MSDYTSWEDYIGLTPVEVLQRMEAKLNWLLIEKEGINGRGANGVTMQREIAALERRIAELQQQVNETAPASWIIQNRQRRGQNYYPA